MKKHLKKEGNELITNCNQLKLKSSDGKHYYTDVVDIEGILRIIESIPSKKAELIKMWLDKLGKKRITETFDPATRIERLINTYRTEGYAEEWILKRIKGLQNRKKLIDVWKSGNTKNLVIVIKRGG